MMGKKMFVRKIRVSLLLTASSRCHKSSVDLQASAQKDKWFNFASMLTNLFPSNEFLLSPDVTAIRKLIWKFKKWSRDAQSGP